MEKIVCNNCNNLIPNNSIYCMYCGKKTVRIFNNEKVEIQKIEDEPNIESEILIEKDAFIDNEKIIGKHNLKNYFTIKENNTTVETESFVDKKTFEKEPIHSYEIENDKSSNKYNFISKQKKIIEESEFSIIDEIKGNNEEKGKNNFFIHVRKTIRIILNYFRYFLGVLFIILSFQVDFLIHKFWYLLLGISLLPLVYRIVSKKIELVRKHKIKLEIILPIIVFFMLILSYANDATKITSDQVENVIDANKEEVLNGIKEILNDSNVSNIQIDESESYEDKFSISLDFKNDCNEIICIIDIYLPIVNSIFKEDELYSKISYFKLNMINTKLTYEISLNKFFDVELEDIEGRSYIKDINSKMYKTIEEIKNELSQSVKSETSNSDNDVIVDKEENKNEIVVLPVKETDEDIYKQEIVNWSISISGEFNTLSELLINNDLTSQSWVNDIKRISNNIIDNCAYLETNKVPSTYDNVQLNLVNACINYLYAITDLNEGINESDFEKIEMASYFIIIGNEHIEIAQSYIE